MIGVLDYGIGNVKSVVNMIKKIGADVIILNTENEIKKVDKLIIPGVGSFDTGIRKLRESGLIDAINKHAIKDKKPLLGICLGMQILGRSSEEGSEKGLSFIPFDNVKFKFKENSNKIPHMGWNYVTANLKDEPLLKDLDKEQRYYFVHSFHAVCDNEDNILMKSVYGYEFIAAVKKDNIVGFQFHPEKSHRYGMAILNNFVRNI